MGTRKRHSRKGCCKVYRGKDGSISNVEVDRSVSPSLDNEAMRVIKNMPKWIPGQINGKAVKVECSHPFVFRLQ